MENNAYIDGPQCVGSGALRSGYSPNDYIWEQTAEAPSAGVKLPSEFDLRVGSPVRNQGQRSTCAAIVAADIAELNQNTYKQLSAEFIYYHRDNKPARGMYPRNTLEIMKTIGAPPEKLFPYRQESVGQLIPKKRLYKIAAQNKIATYARVLTVDGLAKALIEVGPCFILLPMYSRRPEFWLAGPHETCTSGHALTVVGYNRVGFILKNSWGDKWNGDGYITFPFTDWHLVWECWVPIPRKKKNTLKAIKKNKSKCFIL